MEIIQKGTMPIYDTLRIGEKDVKLGWDAPIFEMDIEEFGKADVVTWNSFAEDCNKCDWNILQATENASTVLVAIPEDIISEYSLRDENVSSDQVWKLFREKAGSAWRSCRLRWKKENHSLLENAKPFDFKEFAHKTSKLEPAKIGSRCLDDFDKWFPTSRSLIEGSVTGPYERMLRALPADIAKACAVYVTEEGNVIPQLKAEADPELREYADKARYSVGIFNPHLVFDSAEEKSAITIDKRLRSRETASHMLMADIVLFEKDGAGGWQEIKRSNNQKLAEIPAMNMENGLFIRNGNIYAIYMQTDMEYLGTRIITAAMALKNAIMEGVADFHNQIAVNLSSSDFKATRALNRIFDKASMQIGLDKLLSSDSGLWNLANTSNPISCLRSALTVRIGEFTPEQRQRIANGTDSYAKELLNAQKDVTLSRSCIFDYYSSPEGRKAQSVARLTYGARIDDNGIVTFPFYEIDNGKIDRSRVVWKEMLKRRSIHDTEDTAPPAKEPAMEELLYIHAGDINEDCSYRRESDGTVFAQMGNHISLIRPEDARFCTISPRAEHTAGTDTGTAPSMVNEVRFSIGSSNKKDAVVNHSQDLPLIASNDKSIGQNTIHKAKDNGQVIRIITEKEKDGIERPVSMSVIYDSGVQESIDLRERSASNGNTVSREWPVEGLRSGIRFHKGDALTNAPGIERGEITLGADCLCCCISDLNATDDHIAVSYEFAHSHPNIIRMTEEYEVNEENASSPFGPSFIFNPTIGTGSSSFGGYDCSRLGLDGILRNGERVSEGDVLFFIAKPNGSKKRSIHEQIAMKRPESGVPFTDLPTDYKIEPVVFSKKMDMANARVERFNNAYGKTVISVSAIKEKPLETGDKYSFSGIKATISVLEKDEGLVIHAKDTPLDGKKIDVYLNDGGLGHINRKTPAEFVNGALGLAVIANGRRYDIGAQSLEIREATSDELEKAGLANDGRLYVSGHVMNTHIPSYSPQLIAVLALSNGMNVNKNAREIIGNEAKSLSVMDMNIYRANNLNAALEEVRRSGKTEDMTGIEAKAAFAAIGVGITSKSADSDSKTAVKAIANRKTENTISR